MATNTPATDARKYHHDLVHYISVPIDGADGAQTVVVGKLPAGAAVIGGGIVVVTALNGTGTVSLGVTGDTSDFASALVATVAGVIVADDLATASKSYQTVDTDIIATVGGTPTSGAAYAYVQYIIANRVA